MPNIGVLSADFTADTASFEASLGRARRELSTTGGQMQRSLQAIEKEFTKVSRAVGVFGVSLGAAAIGAFVISAARAAAGIGEVAEQLGVSTDALQQYRFGAVQAGLSQEQLETGLRNLTRRLGEAANGSSEAIEAFRKLGIGVIDPLTGKTRSTEDAFRDLAEAYRLSADKSKFAADAADLLGAKLGQRFISLLAGGAKGLDDIATAANAAGAVIGGKTIKELDELSDSFDRGTIVAKAYAAELGINVVRALQKTGQQLTSMEGLSEAIGLSGLSRRLGSATRSALGLPQRATPAPVLTDSQAADQTTSGFEAGSLPRGGGSATLPQSDAQKRKVEEAKQLVRSLELERDSEGQTAAAILKMRMERELDIEATIREGQEVRKYTDEQVQAAVAIQQQIDQRRQLREAALAVAEAEEITARETLEAQEALNRQQMERANEVNRVSDLNEQIEAAQRATVEWDRLSQAYRVNTREVDIVIEKQRILAQSTGISADEAQKMAAQQVDAQERLRQATAAQEAQVQRANETSRDFAHVITNNLEDALLRTAKASDVAKAAMADFQRILVRVLLTKPLEGMLTGALSGLSFARLFNFGGGSSLSTGTSAIELQHLSQPGVGPSAFATGTDSAPSGLAWVGERGRELINFAGGEQVLRGDEVGGMGGDQYFIDGRGADRQGLARLEGMIAALNGSIERRAVAATMDARLRGGRFREAFR